VGIKRYFTKSYLFVVYMILTLGYLKDAIAVIGFIALFIIVYNIEKIEPFKIYLLILLSIGFVVDGIFTLYPELHNQSYTII